MSANILVVLLFLLVAAVGYLALNWNKLSKKIKALLMILVAIGGGGGGIILQIDFEPTAWADGDYNYCQGHTINSASGAPSGYQVMLTIIRGAGSSSGDTMYIDTAKCQADFDDIRFYDDDNTTELDFWIEEIDGSTATFWIEENDALTSNQQMFIYYDNSEATSASSASNTWNFYDDFNDLTAWTQRSGSWTVSSGNLVAPITADAQIVTTSFTQEDVRVRAYGKITDDYSIGYGIMARTSDYENLYKVQYRGVDPATHEIQIYERNGGSWSKKDYDDSLTLDTNYHIMELLIDGSNISGNFPDQSIFVSAVDTSHTGAEPIGFRYGGASPSTFNVDWVAVGKWNNPEPQHGAWTGEEEYSAIVIPDIRNQGPTNGTIVSLGDLYAEGNDSTLDIAWLATNESGSWVNYTDHSYNFAISNDRAIIDTENRSYDPNAYIASNGSIVVVFSEENHYTGRWFTRSDDNGATWSSAGNWSDVLGANWDYDELHQGFAYKLSTGNYMLIQKAANESVWSMTSTDGFTWENLTSLWASTASNKTIPYAYEIANGSVLYCIADYDDGSYPQIWVNKSDDGGNTWADWGIIDDLRWGVMQPEGEVRCNQIQQFQNDTVIATWYQKFEDKERYSLSQDNGKTWTNGSLLEPTGDCTDFQYRLLEYHLNENDEYYLITYDENNLAIKSYYDNETWRTNGASAFGGPENNPVWIEYNNTRDLWFYGFETNPVTTFTTTGQHACIGATSGMPPAFHYVGTYNRTYFAFQGQGEDPYVKYYDHDTGTWSSEVKVGNNPLYRDSHGTPAICVDNEGYIHVYFAGHPNMRKVVSDNPEDIGTGIGDWTQDWTPSGDNLTYPVVVIVNNTRYFFCRDIYDDQYWAVFKNESGEIRLLQVDEGGIGIYGSGVHHQTNGADDDQIWMTWVSVTVSTSRRQHVYCAYYNLTDDKMYSPVGTAYSTPVTKATWDTVFRVYESSSTEDDFNPRVRTDASGAPFIAWAHWDRTANESRDHITRWTGSAWTTPVNIGTGWDDEDIYEMIHRSGDFAITSGSGASAMIYFLTDDELDDEIKLMISTDGGATWREQETIDDQSTEDLRHIHLIGPQRDLKGGFHDEFWFYYTQQNGTAAQEQDAKGYTWGGCESNDIHAFDLDFTYTGYYNSPQDMDALKTWTWANFTWGGNLSLTEEDPILWEIFFQDTSGNVNGSGVNTLTVGTYFAAGWNNRTAWSADVGKTLAQINSSMIADGFTSWNFIVLYSSDFATQRGIFIYDRSHDASVTVQTSDVFAVFASTADGWDHTYP